MWRQSLLHTFLISLMAGGISYMLVAVWNTNTQREWKHKKRNGENNHTKISADNWSVKLSVKFEDILRREYLEGGIHSGSLIQSQKRQQGKGLNNVSYTIRSYNSPSVNLLKRASKRKFYKELLETNKIGKLVTHVALNISGKINPSMRRKFQEKFPFHQPHSVSQVSCDKLFNNDVYYQKLVTTSRSLNASNLFSTNEKILKSIGNCIDYKKHMGYIVENVSLEEMNFPLAYNILVYKDAGQVERLLRAIYRPQNYYCVHIDKKSDNRTREAIKSITQCFKNVFIPSRMVDVNWGTYGVLEAEMVCMMQLYRRVSNSKKKWKYFINLTGQEFPLKTNWEIVQILKAYNGASDVGGTTSRFWSFRWQSLVHLPPGKKHIQLGGRNSPPPHNYTMAKGSTHVALTHEMVDFIIRNPLAHDLYSWLYPTHCPEETFFSTLFHSPQLKVPTAYTGPPNQDYGGMKPMVRFKQWGNHKTCKGRVQRDICIVSIWDLPLLKRRPELFVNKLEAGYHPLAYHCLEEWHHDKTLEEMTAHAQGLVLHLDARGYQQLPWVKHHL